MSAAYVGMSTMEGMCEVVEMVASNPISRANPESSVDKFVFVGSVTGSTGLDPAECFLALYNAIVGSALIYGEVTWIGLEARSSISPGDVLYLGFLETGRRGIILQSHNPSQRGWVRGTGNLWYQVWNQCGRPGGGLKHRIKNWWNTPIRFPRLSPVPVARRVPVFEPDLFRFSLPEIDFHLPEIPPETVRNAAMAAGTIIIIGGMILLAPMGI